MTRVDDRNLRHFSTPGARANKLGTKENVGSPNVIQTSTACQRQQRPEAACYLSFCYFRGLAVSYTAMPALRRLRGLRVVLIGSHTHNHKQLTMWPSWQNKSPVRLWPQPRRDLDQRGDRQVQRIAAVAQPNLRCCGRHGLLPALVPQESKVVAMGPPHPRRARRGEALPALYIAPAGSASAM